MLARVVQARQEIERLAWLGVTDADAAVHGIYLQLTPTFCGRFVTVEAANVTLRRLARNAVLHRSRARGARVDGGIDAGRGDPRAGRDLQTRVRGVWRSGPGGADVCRRRHQQLEPPGDIAPAAGRQLSATCDGGLGGLEVWGSGGNEVHNEGTEKTKTNEEGIFCCSRRTSSMRCSTSASSRRQGLLVCRVHERGGPAHSRGNRHRNADWVIAACDRRLPIATRKSLPNLSVARFIRSTSDVPRHVGYSAQPQAPARRSSISAIRSADGGSSSNGRQSGGSIRYTSRARERSRRASATVLSRRLSSPSR